MLKWLATFLVLWFIYEVREVFPPMIVGAIIAYLLLPVVNALSVRTRLPLGAATGVVYFLLAAVFGVAAWYFLPAAWHEIVDLANQKEAIITKVVTEFATATHWEGDTAAVTQQMLDGLSEHFGNATGIADVGKTISHGALAVLVCVVSSIYLTLDSHSVGQFFLRYLPEERRPEAVVLANRMNKLLSKYVQGQLLLIVLMSTVAWVFLQFVVHMRYAIPVAILSGFLEIIPVLGPIMAISTAALVGLWQFGPSYTPLIIVGFYTIARWVEDYVVVPKVIGHAVELHPLAVIFAVLCGERLAGALGMLIAIPVAACVKLFIDFFYFGMRKRPMSEIIAAQEQTMVDPERTKPLASPPQANRDDVGDGAGVSEPTEHQVVELQSPKLHQHQEK
jgi:predicted PurR-regulated permease PerM